MQLDLKQLPFGQYMSRHLLFEETDPMGRGWEKGLYLALAAGSNSMFGGFAMRSAGFIRLTPLAGGKEVPGEAEADPAQAVIRCEGGSIRLAIDGPAILLKGEKAGLKMVVKLGRGETVTRTKRGYELVMGATRYIIALKKGKSDLQVGWDLEGLSSTDPIITLEPEDGVMEAIFWDTTAAYAMPEVAPDVDTAAKKAGDAFEAFRASLRGKDELNAYVLWLGFMACRGGKLVIANKIGNVQANAMDQALAALAFKDASPALELVADTLRLMTPGGIVPAWVKGEQSLPEAPPPLWGLALCRVFAAGGIDSVDKDKLAEGYALLTKAVDWWIKNRSLADGSFFYAYAHESGWDGAPVLPFGQGAVTPDLAAWMALNAGALEAMAKKLGLEAEAANWAAMAKKQLDVLASLRKDGKFLCRSALTGDEVPCPVGIGLLPLLVGDAAPDAAALRAKAEKAERLPQEQAGLIALECPALAKKLLAAGAAQPGTLSGGAYRPVLSALLLALEERS
jgi:Glycogen debranching enzyme